MMQAEIDMLVYKSTEDPSTLDTCVILQCGIVSEEFGLLHCWNHVKQPSLAWHDHVHVHVQSSYACQWLA